MNKWFHSRKKWLNKNGFHSQAYIITAVEDKRKANVTNQWSIRPEITFTMADCNEKIDLIFSVDNDEWQNSEFKLNTLLDEIYRFEKALYKAREVWEKQNELVAE